MASQISGLPSSRFDFNPQRMLLDLGHQQDLILLLFGTRELVPTDMLGDIERAKIVITNYHAFKLRERVDQPP